MSVQRIIYSSLVVPTIQPTVQPTQNKRTRKHTHPKTTKRNKTQPKKKKQTNKPKNKEYAPALKTEKKPSQHQCPLPPHPLVLTALSKSYRFKERKNTHTHIQTCCTTTPPHPVTPQPATPPQNLPRRATSTLAEDTSPSRTRSMEGK
jgi:hypothetical protein